MTSFIVIYGTKIQFLIILVVLAVEQLRIVIVRLGGVNFLGCLSRFF